MSRSRFREEEHIGLVTHPEDPFEARLADIPPRKIILRQTDEESSIATEAGEGEKNLEEPTATNENTTPGHTGFLREPDQEVGHAVVEE